MSKTENKITRHGGKTEKSTKKYTKMQPCDMPCGGNSRIGIQAICILGIRELPIKFVFMLILGCLLLLWLLLVLAID